jgi:dTMP kinase
VTARFIVFEGGEACGKSTQARLLSERLGAVLTREPGGTPVGEQMRMLLLDPATGALEPRAEALLMAADRAQHVESVIRPALAAGRHVVSDRYAASSVAYQGFGRGLDVAEVRRISEWATAGLRPDLTVLLDVPVEVSARRLEGSLDRFEREGETFHERVVEGFRIMAASGEEPWVVVDGAASIEMVAARVRAVVRDRLQLPV